MKRPTWLKLDLLAPIVTIIAACAASLLDLYGIIQVTKGETIILTLIALLAIDALIERVKILNEIRNDIKRITTRNDTLQDIFQPRTALKPLEDRFLTSKSIDIAAPSLLAIVTSHHELLLKKASEGCKIRLLLQNPNNEVLMKTSYILVAALSPDDQKEEIVKSLNRLMDRNPYLQSGLIQIRTHDYPFTHSLLITNSEVPSGELRVELYIQGRRPNRTPGFVVHKATDPKLFDEFAKEFNDLWDKAQPPTTPTPPAPDSTA